MHYISSNVMHMPRPREANEPATHVLTIRVTPGLLTWLDKNRGPLTRSHYVRHLIRTEAAKTGTQR
jgi:hypothetical protein